MIRTPATAPEVVQRCERLLPLIRKEELARFTKAFAVDTEQKATFEHPVWKRYVAMVGDSKPSRLLFAEIVKQNEWMSHLDAAEGDPTKAGDIYRAAMREVGERIVMGTGLGMTEGTPYCLGVNSPNVRAGDIGVPTPGLELKLVPMDGKTEVRYRGPNITPGYWRNPEATFDSFDAEGFFCSGDAVQWIDAADRHQGLKFDGRQIDVNIAAFYSQFDNFQLNTFNGLNFIVVNINDWNIFLANNGTSFSDMSAAETYSLGDLNGDLVNDLKDFRLFKADYTAVNGAGAFAAPLLLVSPPTVSWRRARRRSTRRCSPVSRCPSTSSSSSWAKRFHCGVNSVPPEKMPVMPFSRAACSMPRRPRLRMW